MAAKYAYSHICSVCGRDYYASGARICKRGRLKGKHICLSCCRKCKYCKYVSVGYSCEYPKERKIKNE